jgi:hypothetical protein
MERDLSALPSIIELTTQLGLENTESKRTFVLHRQIVIFLMSFAPGLETGLEFGEVEKIMRIGLYVSNLIS